MFVCRINSAEYFNHSIAAIEYYQFPGSGTEYPIASKQIIVIAQDAIDHVNVGGARGSIDLSKADCEFYNQHVPDIDNPRVPNLINAAPELVDIDFFINMKADEVCLIQCDDIDPVRYCEGNGQITNFRIFNISCVLDGVEYSPNSNHLKTFDIRIDTGIAGYKINWYTGKSIEDTIR